MDIAHNYKQIPQIKGLMIMFNDFCHYTKALIVK